MSSWLLALLIFRRMTLSLSTSNFFASITRRIRVMRGTSSVPEVAALALALAVVLAIAFARWP